MWNNFVSPSFRTDVGVGQGSVLSPILSTLYIAPVFHIFEKRSKNIFQKHSVSFIFFVDDNICILQEKSFEM